MDAKILREVLGKIIKGGHISIIAFAGPDKRSEINFDEDADVRANGLIILIKESYEKILSEK